MKISKDLRSKLLSVKRTINPDAESKETISLAKRITPALRRALVMRRNGMTFDEISRLLNIPASRISKSIGQATVKRTEPTDDERNIIISKWSDGVSLRKIILSTKLPGKTVIRVVEEHEKITGQPLRSSKKITRSRSKKRGPNPAKIDEILLFDEETSIRNQISHEISTLRIQCGLSLRDMARLSGVNKLTIHKMETTGSSSVTTLAKIAGALGKKLTIKLQEKTPDEPQKALSKLGDEWHHLQDGYDLGVDVATIRSKLGCSVEELAEFIGLPPEKLLHVEKTSIKTLPKRMRQALLFLQLRLDIPYEFKPPRK